jgi:hypothetical protein
VTDHPTQAARLAAVLHLLAECVEVGTPNGSAVSAEAALASAKYALVMIALRASSHDDLVRAERHAAEAARLAGISANGWRTGVPSEADNGKFFLIQIDGTGFDPMVAEWDDCEEHWKFDDFDEYEPSDVLAYHELPEPYRAPKETGR